MSLRLKVPRTGSTWIRTPYKLAHHLKIQTFLFITLFSYGKGGGGKGMRAVFRSTRCLQAKATVHINVPFGFSLRVKGQLK